MTTTLQPETQEQVCEAVAWAASEKAPLEVVGHGSKRGLGRPVQASHALNLSRLSGIMLYEPEELILSAKAGTPMAEIEAAVFAKNQRLAFEPTDLGPLLGGQPGKQTLGGVIACNLSGPRRIQAGAARDHFLGLEAVSGRGEIFKAGGRVVKNVTGYDLCKLLAGSYGTLSVLTDITIKVLPAPEETRTVLVYDQDDADALKVMTQALRSRHDVSAASHLPAAVAYGLSGLTGSSEARAVTAIRLEGPEPSVAFRCQALREELTGFGDTDELDKTRSGTFWAGVRDVRPLIDEEPAAVWKISVPPQSGPSVNAGLSAKSQGRYYYDWGGGLLWYACGEGQDASQEEVHRTAAAHGGHATLVRASHEIRAAKPVFQPADDGKHALTKRIKENFDPLGILNPGRMYSGI